jgi:MFS family permease
MSVYLLAYVPAPFIIAPLSEMYGRRPAYLICHAFYILFNSLCPFGKSKSVMIAYPFLSGLGGACGITVSVVISLPLNIDVDDRHHLAVGSFDGRHLAN